MRLTASAIFILGLLFNPASSPAQLAVGTEFQINTTTTFTQGPYGVTPDGAGGFVVVWLSGSSAGTDSDAYSIQGQRYSAEGSPVGGEFQINSYTTSSQLHPEAGPDGAGGFVVVWGSEGSSGTDSDSYSIQGQRFASNGNAEGEEFQINSFTPDKQSFPATGPDGAGGFVVVWNSRGSNGMDSDSDSIQGQRFLSNGEAEGGEFQINNYSTASQRYPVVSLDGSGGFVVVWQSDGSSGTDSDLSSIQGQRFASNGTKVGDEFQINTYTSSMQQQPAISPDGTEGFVVAWNSEGSNGTDASSTSIQGQRFSSDGNAIGGQFQVNTTETGFQVNPSVGFDSAGGFVVSWSSQYSAGTDSSSFSIQGQRFGLSGAPKGNEFQVNTYTISVQEFSTIGSDGDKGFVIAWGSKDPSGTDTSLFSVQGQRFSAHIFSDGFEGGNTTAWSGASP